MHGLNTTNWVFDTTDYTTIKVVDQYRNTEEALAGALRVIKGLMEGLTDVYTVNLLNDEVMLEGDFVKGICLTVDELNVGTFVPQAELETPFQIFMDGDTHFNMF